MIRLVHQFDDPQTRAVVASPKSEMCSCCCCCSVASLLTASVLTARAVGRSAPTSLVLPPPGRGAQVAAPPSTLGWKVLGFFLLPLSIAFTALLLAAAESHFNASVVAGLVGLGCYVGGLFLLRAKAGLRGGWIAGLLAGLPVAMVLEAMVWMAGMGFFK